MLTVELIRYIQILLEEYRKVRNQMVSIAKDVTLERVGIGNPMVVSIVMTLGSEYVYLMCNQLG